MKKKRRSIDCYNFYYNSLQNNLTIPYKTHVTIICRRVSCDGPHLVINVVSVKWITMSICKYNKCNVECHVTIHILMASTINVIYTNMSNCK